MNKLDMEIYKTKTNFRLPHHTLVDIKNTNVLKEYILMEVKWLLENTSDNIFILIDDSNKIFWKNYIDNDRSVKKQIVLIEFDELFLEKCWNDNFIRNSLFIGRDYNKPSWFFIGSIDDKYKDILKRYLRGGRKYRLNLICLDYKMGNEMYHMFNHHQNVIKL